MWKVKHLSGGLYSIRPMHKLDMGLSAPSSDVRLTEIGTTDSLSGVATNSRWKIYYNGSGYVLQCEGSAARTLAPFSNVTIVDALVSALAYSSTTAVQHWTFTKITSPPKGFLLYDAVSGKIATDNNRYLAAGHTKFLDDLLLDYAVYSGNSISQSVNWSRVSGAHVTISSQAGAITAGSNTGTARIRLSSQYDTSISGEFLITITASDRIWYYKSMYTEEFSSLAGNINKAENYADHVYSKNFEFSVFHSDTVSLNESIAPNGCPVADIDSPCAFGGACGPCDGDHHKDINNISNQLMNLLVAGDQENDHIAVLWTDRARNTYCDYDNIENTEHYHVTLDYNAVVANSDPTILFMHVYGNAEAFMGITLIHETAHCFGFSDEEGYLSGVHDTIGEWTCVMEGYEYINGLDTQFYENIIRIGSSAFCAECKPKIEAYIEEMLLYRANAVGGQNYEDN